ncbi:hypothetical protein GJA_2111 [Janthinobacterium agaricidamnosum NBRC 102515 = DSM 9628]|uniref:Uncharacterized protein n=1 Tax=Janthinobacterium agaricidamnosum NBRC 102515 = DSM 9628 TaxID=1349767 RepID=W0V4D5_9BURK|nr:hypothetical protein GJA_2111 [Janthinobacterium agaricidamnosum NBRC 102515 = DSM 9628]
MDGSEWRLPLIIVKNTAVRQVFLPAAAQTVASAYLLQES